MSALSVSLCWLPDGSTIRFEVNGSDKYFQINLATFFARRVRLWVLVFNAIQLVFAFRYGPFTEDDLKPLLLQIVADFLRLVAAKIGELREASMPRAQRDRQIASLRRGLIPALTKLNDTSATVDQYIEIINRFPSDAGLVKEAWRCSIKVPGRRIRRWRNSFGLSWRRR